MLWALNPPAFTRRWNEVPLPGVTISAKLFGSLPDDEKLLWHSHVYEVSSGALIAPGLPDIAERELIQDLIGTYGKTFHTWQVDRGDQLPLAIPQLMMGFTQDGQLDPLLLQNRDNRYDTSSDKKRQDRMRIERPAIAPGANAWQRSAPVQLLLNVLDRSPAQ